jgi:hypothetical protein
MEGLLDPLPHVSKRRDVTTGPQLRGQLRHQLVQVVEDVTAKMEKRSRLAGARGPDHPQQLCPIDEFVVLIVLAVLHSLAANMRERVCFECSSESDQTQKESIRQIHSPAHPQSLTLCHARNSFDNAPSSLEYKKPSQSPERQVIITLELNACAHVINEPLSIWDDGPLPPTQTTGLVTNLRQECRPVRLL